MSSLRLPKAVMPIEDVRFVHSWPTYNLGVQRRLDGVEFDKATGILVDKDPASGGGEPLWLVKGEGLCSPADYWQGDKLMPAWDKTTDWGAYHGAVDIAPNPKGTLARVSASFPGQVIEAHIGGNHSCRVMILTEVGPANGGVKALLIYQHLGPGLHVRKGDVVKPGDVIGYLGSWEGKLSGNEHLHVEVISKKRLPGVGDAFCVPCPESGGKYANSQYKDYIFGDWIELPYVMNNLIACIKGWNRYASSA